MEAPPLQSYDFQELLTKLSIGITLNRARKLGKAPLLAVLNHIGIPEAARNDLASVIFPGTPTLPPEQSPSEAAPSRKSKVSFDQAVAQEIKSPRIAGLKLGDQLAESTRATVFRGTLKGESVVIKFYCNVGDDPNEELRKELEALQNLSHHPNVVRVLSFVYAPPPCVVSPFIAQYDLRFHLNRSGPLESEEARSMSLSIAKGLRYIHESGFIHRDLKSSNVFLNEKLEPLIGDFGLASVTAARTKILKYGSLDSFTPRWMAPEMIRGEQYTNAVDVYSFGIIVWELLDGSIPYSQSYATIEVALAAVLRGERPLKGSRHTGILAEVMEMCWPQDEGKRPTMKRVVRLLDPNANAPMEPLPRQVVAPSEWTAPLPGCLEFYRGDRVKVLRELKDGWLEGEANGKRGSFPSFTIAEIDEVRRATEQGNAAAQYELGRRYEFAYDVEEDEQEALKWYRKASNQGDVNALYTLAICYAAGKGVAEDQQAAVKWYRKAADQGHALAQYDLGFCCSRGTGVERNAREAVKWYRKAADQGYHTAQFNLAICCELGVGIEKNEREAVKWYRKAADLDNEAAQFRLALCYGEGMGVEKDQREAVKWYRKAADQGHAMAQYAAGLCYEEGTGIEKNEQEAIKWYLKSAAQDYEGAQTRLGICYARGTGVAKNEQEAVKWYRKAADKGFAEGQYNLAMCYEDGRGVAKDNREAAKWFRKAAEQNHAVSQFDLAVCYTYGTGVPQDDREAAKWYLKSAEQGYDKAQMALAMCYLRSTGVEHNPLEGLKWLTAAAAQGEPEACAALEALRRH